MAAPRLRREIFAPMEEVGLPSEGADLARATIAALREALERDGPGVGWTLPSLRHQPVLDARSSAGCCARAAAG